MRRSKPEMYIELLTVLAHRGPQKSTHVMNQRFLFLNLVVSPKICELRWFRFSAWAVKAMVNLFMLVSAFSVFRNRNNQSACPQFLHFIFSSILPNGAISTLCRFKTYHQ